MDLKLLQQSAASQTWHSLAEAWFGAVMLGALIVLCGWLLHCKRFCDCDGLSVQSYVRRV
jgi:hypothetical protein